MNNRSNNGYLTPHRVAGKNPNACASSQLDWWHHRDQAQSWDQKAQSEACLLPAAHTVQHEKAQTSSQRGTQVTQPPEGYLWAAEERETEENKSVISRRLGVSRRIGWIITASRRKELILEWAPINCFTSVGSIRYSMFPLSELCIEGPSSLLQPHWPQLKN